MEERIQGIHRRPHLFSARRRPSTPRSPRPPRHRPRPRRPNHQLWPRFRPITTKIKARIPTPLEQLPIFRQPALPRQILTISFLATTPTRPARISRRDRRSTSHRPTATRILDPPARPNLPRPPRHQLRPPPIS